MRKLKTALALLLAAVLLAGLAACGPKTEAPDPALEANAGKYMFYCAEFGTAFANQLLAAYDLEANDVGNQYVEYEQMDGRSILLNADGTGYLDWGDDNQGDLTWTATGNKIAIKAGVSDIPGTITDGLLGVTIDEGFNAYFLLEGAAAPSITPLPMEDYIDLLLGNGTAETTAAPEETTAAPEETTAAPAAGQEGSLLGAVWAGMDPAAGVHMNYDLSTENIDSVTNYEVHGKGDRYYSRRTTEVAGYEGVSITLFMDGNAYNLDPEDMTAMFVTSASINTEAVAMDSLYSAMKFRVGRADFTVEERVIDGVTYTAEIYPDAGAGLQEAVFCFDQQGNLAYYITTPSESLGETVYKVNTIDSAVDESLFTLDGYTMTES